MRNVITKVALAATLALGLQVSANAAAVNLGAISGTKTIEMQTQAGSFNDLFTFTTANLSLGGFAVQSIIFQTISGVSVTAANVYEGIYTDPSQLSGATVISAPTQMTSTISNNATIITLATSTSVAANTSYTFQIVGTSLGKAGYTGIIALTDTIRVTPPVPEPETYAMLLAGLGMMGMIARRRQQNR